MQGNEVVLRAPRPGIFWITVLLVAMGIFYMPEGSTRPEQPASATPVALHTSPPPTAAPPTIAPPTAVPPTAVPPTAVPPAAVPTVAPPPSPTLILPTRTPTPVAHAGDLPMATIYALITQYQTVAYAYYSGSTLASTAVLEEIAGGQAVTSVQMHTDELHSAGNSETLLALDFKALATSKGDARANALRAQTQEQRRIKVVTASGDATTVVETVAMVYTLETDGVKWKVTRAEMRGAPTVVQ